MGLTAFETNEGFGFHDEAIVCGCLSLALELTAYSYDPTGYWIETVASLYQGDLWSILWDPGRDEYCWADIFV